MVGWRSGNVAPPMVNSSRRFDSCPTTAHSEPSMAPKEQSEGYQSGDGSERRVNGQVAKLVAVETLL